MPTNVKQPKCGETVVYTDGSAIYPALVNNQSDPAPSPVTAPADLLSFDSGGGVTPRTAVPFDDSATPAPNTWRWKKDA
jgi:hypothetical protein